MPLIAAGPLFYLPVHVAESVVGAVSEIDALGLDVCEIDMIQGVRDVMLYEYCCSPTSLLTA
eukprot:7550785-Heterocapsa_arctica.AAC.1